MTAREAAAVYARLTDTANRKLDGKIVLDQLLIDMAPSSASSSVVSAEKVAGYQILVQNLARINVARHPGRTINILQQIKKDLLSSDRAVPFLTVNADLLKVLNKLYINAADLEADHGMKSVRKVRTLILSIFVVMFSETTLSAVLARSLGLFNKDRTAGQLDYFDQESEEFLRSNSLNFL